MKRSFGMKGGEKNLSDERSFSRYGKNFLTFMGDGGQFFSAGRKSPNVEDLFFRYINKVIS